MKFIHCADLHLDAKMETNLSTKEAKERRLELLSTFENMVGYAVSHDVAAIIIAGDLFDTANSKQKTIKNRVLSIIRENSDVDFLYLRGNHDRDDFFSTVEDKPENLKLFSNEWITYSYGNIDITGIEFSDTERDIYLELNLKENRFNIVVLHGQESEYASDRDADVINLSALKHKNIDYLALGHIHNYKISTLDNRGQYCYSGCLEGRGFDECGTKGFVVVDVGDDGYKTEFVSIAKRSMHEILVDISDVISGVEIVNRVRDMINEIPSEDMVKVVLVGEIDEDVEIDIGLIEYELKPFYFSKIKDQSEYKIDYMKYEKDISLKGEFIRTVRKLDIPDEDKNKVIITGIRALVGKEVEL